jgi:hypothetical protein
MTFVVSVLAFASGAWADQPASAPASAPTSAPASQPATAPASQPAAQEEDPYAGLDHTGTPALPPREQSLPESSAAPGEKRPEPRYDGREPGAPSAGEVLVWVPRVVFFPVYGVLEYGVRWPIVKLITVAEEHHVPQRVKSWFTFNDDRAGLFPTLFFDFGISPSVGLYFFHDDLGAPNNNLVLQAGYWPAAGGWLHLVGKDSFKVFRNDAGTVGIGAEFIYRPDFVFNGLGHAPVTTERFFRLRQTEAELSLRAVLHDLNRATLGLRYRNTYISDGRAPSVDAVDSPFAPDLAREVPGFGETYNLIALDVRLELDTRSPERVHTPGSGLRLELFSSIAMDPADPGLSFVRYGGEAVGFLDLTGINHVLALRLYTELLEPIGDSVVPITERLVLGGGEHMRGFLTGWFHGDSALVTTLDYRYPVHTMVDANLFVSLGNAFNGRFERLHAKRLAMSWGVGLRTNTSREVSFDLMVAFGTNRIEHWDDDFNVDHVRVVAGINQGF